MIGEEKTLLLAPQTYMNASGRSVGRCASFFQLPIEQLLVVCDDLNLKFGQLRIRPSGSAGGQRGLDDVIRHLGTQNFARLRIGIGRPAGEMDATDYVLSRFRPAEREHMNSVIQTAADAVETWLRDSLDAAMNQFNATSPNDGGSEEQQEKE